MGIPNSMMIAMQEIEGRIDKEAPVKERLKKAMKLAQNHWLITDEDTQFRCAIGAVLVTVSPEEAKIIEREMELLRGISAATTGVPVDVVEMLLRAPKNPYGIQSLWMEAKMEETEG